MVPKEKRVVLMYAIGGTKGVVGMEAMDGRCKQVAVFVFDKKDRHSRTSRDFGFVYPSVTTLKLVVLNRYMW